jgi:hypothetical protein
MKKAILILLLVAIMCLSACGNRNWGPEIGNLRYDMVMIQFAGEVVYNGPIDSWKDHEDGTVDIWFPKSAPFSKALFSNMNVILYNKN